MGHCFKSAVLKFLFVSALIILVQSNLYGQEIQFEKETYDFGEVSWGTEYEHQLKFRNTGTDTLILYSATTASSADVAIIGKHKYAPDEEGFLTYKFIPGGTGYDNRINIRSNSNPDLTSIRVKWKLSPKELERINSENKLLDFPPLDNLLKTTDK